MRTTAPRAALLALLVAPALTACGSTHDALSGSQTANTHVMPDGSVMSDDQMAGTWATPDRGSPTAAAAMICSHETAQAVQRTFALPSVPRAVDDWRRPTYRCDYRLPHGTLRLTVQDQQPGRAARAQFDSTRSAANGARAITGMQGLGLPAFESSAGQVGFLKDGRTLLVDASGVTRADLPPGFSRMGTAYAVAAAVIACWSE